MEKERRKSPSGVATVSRRDLNSIQQMTLVNLEQFGWELKFIRRPLFQDPIAVVFDSERKHFAVLEADGTLNENPGFDIRK